MKGALWSGNPFFSPTSNRPRVRQNTPTALRNDHILNQFDHIKPDWFEVYCAQKHLDWEAIHHSGHLNDEKSSANCSLPTSGPFIRDVQKRFFGDALQWVARPFCVAHGAHATVMHTEKGMGVDFKKKSDFTTSPIKVSNKWREMEGTFVQKILVS